jgi:arsenate reductase
MIQVLHNPRCGKSRSCLTYLNECNLNYEIINYLETPLSVQELKELLKKLQLSPIDIIRQKESIWITNYKGKTLSDDELLNSIVANPILIERPIVVSNGQAIIGRDFEKLKDFFI